MRDQLRLAIELAERGRHEEATELLRTTVRSDPANTAAWKWLAHTTADPGEALVAVRTVLSQDPSDAWAREAWPAYEQRARETRGRQKRRRERQAMRFLALLLLALLLSLCGAIGYLGRNSQMVPQLLGNESPSPTPTVELEESSRLEYYSIHGATIADIQQELSSEGPEAPGGTHTIAMTNYELYVTWEMAQSLGVCRLENIVVHLDIIYTYPQWNQPDGADAEAVEEWERFEPYVTEHEERHGEIARTCAQQLVTWLQSFEAGESCATAEEVLNTLVNDLYTQCEAEQQAFDEAEGRTAFPLPTH